MKKKIITLIIFVLIIAFGGDRFLSYVLSKVVDKSEFRYSKLYNNTAEADILVVGNSRGLVFYQPHIEDVTGKSVFNLSYNALPVNMSAALVKDYFERYKNPDVVVVEVSMRPQNKELASNFKLYSKISTNVHAVVKEEDKTTMKYAKFFNLILYNSEIFQRTLYHFKKSDKHWLNDRVINERKLASEVVVDTNYFNITQEAIDYYAEIKSVCEQNGTKCKFVMSPYLPKFINKLDQYNDYISLLESELDSPIYDYSKFLNDPQLFADFVHINKRGSKVFIEELNRVGVFN